MKKIILSLIALIAFSCSENETTYSVDSDLEIYVNTFIDEANERGVTITKNNLIVKFGETQSVTNLSIKDGQNYLYVSSNIGHGSVLEYNIFNSLGELYVKNKVVISDPSQYSRESYFNELFM